MWSGLGWGEMVVGSIIMLLFWGIIIALLFFAVRAFFFSNKYGGRQETQKSALDILKERYARGEITREEYQEIKNELEK